MLNDPLANTLNNILNAEKIGKPSCMAMPVSGVIKKILTIMQDHKYIGKQEYVENRKGDAVTIHLIGAINKCGVIKPRFPVQFATYEKFEKRFLPAKDFGILIVSTSQGIMTHIQAKEKQLGGKLLAYIY